MRGLTPPRRALRLLSALACLLLLLCSPPAHARQPLVVTFLDVGQGDSAWIQTPEGFDIVIDGGQPDQGPMLVAYLRSRGVTDVEVVVLSHPDADHVGGLVTLLREMPVGLVVSNGESSTTSTYVQFEAQVQEHTISQVAATAGQTFTWGSVTAMVVHPGALSGDLNEDSLTLRVTYGAVDFLFPGDVGFAGETAMLSRALPLDAEVLKVAHHGSAGSTSASFLSAVHPSLAVISVGDNAYGHPSAATLERLTSAGASVYRTDQDGTVTVTPDGTTWTVSCSRWVSTIYLPVINWQSSTSG